MITIHTLAYKLPHKYYIIMNNTIKTTNLIFIGFPIFHIQLFILILEILKFVYCMKVNLNYMSIFYRTPNCTLVNVVQSEPKFYRRLFIYAYYEYIYEWIARAKLHARGPEIGRIPHWSVDTHGGNFKTTHVQLFPN